jgi:hypothetical protein
MRFSSAIPLTAQKADQIAFASLATVAVENWPIAGQIRSEDERWIVDRITRNCIPYYQNL